MNSRVTNQQFKCKVEVKDMHGSFKLNNKEFWNRDVQHKRHQIHCLEILRSIIPKVALVVLVGFLLERTYGIVDNFLSEPTYFETQYVPQYHADLPALTICPLYGYKSSLFKVKCFGSLNWLFTVDEK